MPAMLDLRQSCPETRMVSAKSLPTQVKDWGQVRRTQEITAMKLELLALKWAVTEKFWSYLLGSKFEVFTENNPLKYLQTTAKLGALEQRWDTHLTLFDFIINYWSGRSNANADTLSHQPHGPVPDETEESKEDELLHIESIVTMATSVPLDLSHALVTTPIPIEMRQMAVHEPDHNLSTTNPSSDEDKKLPRDDTVIAITSFPTHTNLSPCKRQTLSHNDHCSVMQYFEIVLFIKFSALPWQSIVLLHVVLFSSFYRKLFCSDLLFVIYFF